MMRIEISRKPAHPLHRPRRLCWCRTNIVLFPRIEAQEAVAKIHMGLAGHGQKVRG